MSASTKVQWWREVEQWSESSRRHFKSHAEYPSYLYELARRTKKPFKDNPEFPPWPDLHWKSRRDIMLSFAPRQDDVVHPRLVVLPFEPESSETYVLQLPRSPGHSELAIIRVDLGASDAALERAFIEWVNGQRTKYEVTKRAKNMGKKNRAKPWNYIELLDAKFLHGDTGKSSMRSRVRLQMTRALTKKVREIFLRKIFVRRLEKRVSKSVV